MSRPRRRVLLGVILLLAGGLSWAVFENLRGKTALRAYRAALIAQGEKLTIAELAPEAPADARRAAGELERAWAQFRDGPILARGRLAGMRTAQPGKARVISREPDLRDDRITNQWNELAAELDQSRQALEDLRRALAAPAFDFNLDYQQSLNLRLSHLASIKSVAQRLSAATLCALHQRRLEEASENLTALLQSVEVLRDEPLLISQLVRLALASFAVGPTWEALQTDGWTDVQLADWQRIWQSLEFLRPLERALNMERAMGLNTFERLRRSAAERRQYFGGTLLTGLGPAPSGLDAPDSVSEVPDFALGLGRSTLSSVSVYGRELSWLWLWSWHDERTFLERMQGIINLPRSAQATGAFVPARSSITDRFDGGTARYFLTGLLTPARHLASAKAARTEAQRALALAAIAIKRYQTRHQRLPSTLSTLVPEFIASVPKDPMDGEDLRYRPNADGAFLLYSVNEDGRDDGGDATPPSEGRAISFVAGRDMVWPMPATAADLAEWQAKEQQKKGSKELLERYGLVPTNPPAKP